MITRQNCSGCHAIGRVGTSPNRRAPPFRTLGARYPLADLTEALTEGIISGHNEMPQFQFSGPQAQAIVAYLQSIQSR